MIIRVQPEDFDAAALQRELLAGRSDVGALASFIGLVRDRPDAPLEQMTLEHYPGMTEKALAAIAEQACERWQVNDLAIIHRIGPLKPADQIVLVMVASAHRGDAFAA
ncbi:MAG: molybdenum cofactor biosynthesis protein MoaE, partial [Gammaproteobacteria bacterium]